LKVGDILTAIDGKPIATSLDLRARIRDAEDGAPARFEVWRNGKVQTLTASLEKRERPEIDLAPLFIRKKDGDRMILSLDGEELLPDKFNLPVPGAGVGPRVRVQTLSGREAELEKRLKELEKRIKDLERQLGPSAQKH
jgi:C-terminal processing protease CtpA/Prc